MTIGYKAKRLQRFEEVRDNIRKWLKALEKNKLTQQRRLREGPPNLDKHPDFR